MASVSQRNICAVARDLSFVVIEILSQVQATSAESAEYEFLGST